MSSILKNTSAVCDGPLESYVLGTHEWRIEGDNVQCSAKGEAYTATLKLTGCREGEFTCYDGQCIRTAAHIYQQALRTRSCVLRIFSYN